MDGGTFALVNDVVILIISVLHSFGLMDFRCRGLDLSMLCDKLSCFRCSCCGLLDLLIIGLSTVMDLGRLTTVLITVSVAGPNFLPGPRGQASTLAGCCNRRSDKRPVLQQVCPKAAEQKRSCPTWLDFYPLI